MDGCCQLITYFLVTSFFFSLQNQRCADDEEGEKERKSGKEMTLLKRCIYCIFYKFNDNDHHTHAHLYLYMYKLHTYQQLKYTPFALIYTDTHIVSVRLESVTQTK